MGRPRKPTELHRLHGTFRKDRHGRAEPKPSQGVPSPPPWLGAAAKKHWKVIAPILAEMGVLTKADGTALALLCDALADYVAAGKVIDAAAHGRAPRFVAKTPQGCLIQHPAVGVKNKAWERVLKVLREFGMTPSSRSGLAAAPKEGEGDWLGDLLEGRN